MFQNQPLWQTAEDSFLAEFSKIKRYPWGSVYLWRDHPEWPKFSFLRVLDPAIMEDEFHSAILAFRTNFQKDAEECFFRLPRSLGLSQKFLSPYKKDSDSIVSIVYNPYECGNETLANSLVLKQCTSEEDLRLWWEVNSDARERKNPFESDLWPFITKKNFSGTKYFLLFDEDRAVTCGAIEQFEGGYNSWGMGTRLHDQNKGYSRAYMHDIGRLFGDRIYSQVDLAEQRYTFLSRLPTTQVLEIEDLYVC